MSVCGERGGEKKRGKGVLGLLPRGKAGTLCLLSGGFHLFLAGGNLREVSGEGCTEYSSVLQVGRFKVMVSGRAEGLYLALPTCFCGFAAFLGLELKYN